MTGFVLTYPESNNICSLSYQHLVNFVPIFLTKEDARKADRECVINGSEAAIIKECMVDFTEIVKG